MIYIFQASYNNMVAFSEKNNIFTSIINRVIGMIMVLIPFTIDGTINRNGKLFLPSVEDIKVFTFNELAENIETVKRMVEKGQKHCQKKT
jgi:hypothetical protein